MPSTARRAGKPEAPSPPSEALLGSLLGKAKRHWDALLAAAAEADASCRAEWVYYKSLKAWRCIVKRGERTLVHLRPDDGCFVASFALSDEALDAAEGHGVPASMIGGARAAKLLPEGRPIRVEVKSAKDVRAAVGIVRAKMGK